MTDLQDLVDGLADGLGRPVGVDDRRLRSVSYSAHVDGIDPVRLASILQREAPGQVGVWLEKLGIFKTDSYLRVPPNPDLGMAARVCVPLRFDDRLLGFLWLIDGPTPLTSAQLDLAQVAAQDIAIALYRVFEAEQSDRQEERGLLRAALGLSAGDRETAAGELLSRGLLASTTHIAVTAITPNHDHDPATDPIRARVIAAVEHERRFAAQGHLLVLMDRERVYALVAFESEADLHAHVESITERLKKNLHGSAGWSAVVGVSGTYADRNELIAARREAELAGTLAGRIPDLAATAFWDELGAYRTLALATEHADPAVLLPVSLQRLLKHPEAEPLVPTLSVYLDLGCDARSAADTLFIHRSSLYHRLRRIEKIVGLDLASGDARLELHLGLRLWEMAGRPDLAGRGTTSVR